MEIAFLIATGPVARRDLDVPRRQRIFQIVQVQDGIVSRRREHAIVERDVVR